MTGGRAGSAFAQASPPDGHHPGISTQRAAASKVSVGLALNAIAASGACRRTRLTTRSNRSS